MKSECLRKVICLGTGGLIRVLREYLDHYDEHRPHQSLGNKPITPVTALPDVTKPIIRIDRLGGAIHHYTRARKDPIVASKGENELNSAVNTHFPNGP